jgi:hypothetical protein
VRQTSKGSSRGTGQGLEAGAPTGLSEINRFAAATQVCRVVSLIGRRSKKR